MKKAILAVLAFAVIGILATQYSLSQQKAKAPLNERVDKAIDKGLDFLVGKYKGKDFKGDDSELVMLTLLHGGMTKKDAIVKKAAKDLIAKKFTRTYNISVMAMAYAEYDPTEYQLRIAECAQFLVDTQCKNGQWGYECPSWKSDVMSSGKKAAVNSGKDAIPQRINIKADPQGGDLGDNSNTQYALLGLRAACDSNIVVPKETFEAAAKFLASRQLNDGGWCYSQLFYNLNDDASYGSMTTAGLGGLCIAKYYLGIDLEKDQSVQRGLDWLGTNFKVEANPGTNTGRSVKDIVEKEFSESIVHYYFLYGLERCAIFSKADKIGTHDWYAEGAEYLLTQQGKEGKWGTGNTETCFAILFLKRATRPLKPVESGFVPKDAPQDK